MKYVRELRDRACEPTSSRKIELADVNEVRPARYSPKSRVDLAAIRPLVLSVESVGMIYPITVGNDMIVGDGHRRLMAAKLLNWQKVPVMVVNDMDAQAVYRHANSTAKKVNSAESLAVWLADPRATSERQNKLFTQMQTDLGIMLVRKIVNYGKGAAIYSLAIKVANHMGQPSPMLRPAVEWLLTTDNLMNVRAAIAGGCPAANFHRAIKNMRPLTLKFE